MKDSQVLVGVDIGTSKIATLVAQVSDESMNILGVAEAPSKGIRRGQIVDIEEVAAAVNSSLDVAERMAGVSVDRVFCSISGVHMESQDSKGIVAISQPNGEIAGADVDRVLEAAGAISIPSTKQIIHVLPKSFSVDGEGGIKDPIGMTGVRLEVDTHIITANSTTVRNIQKMLEEQAGVALSGLVFSGLASSLSVLTETEKELGVVMVDIGAGITNICVFVDGSLAYSKVLPIGAKHITNDLAIGLRVSLDSAEKIKLYLYKTHPRRGETSDVDDIDVAKLALAEEVKKLSKKTLIDGIMKPRLNEIFTMVGLELKKSGLLSQVPSGIVITGGGAKTIGALESAKRMLSLPVRVGEPLEITGLIDEVSDPAYATAVGLLMYGRGSKGAESSSMNIGSFMPKIGFKPLNNILTQLRKLFKSFLPS